MIHGLRQWLLNTIENTRFESVLRRMYNVFSFSKGALYDRQTSSIFKQILVENSNCIDVGAYRGEIVKEIVNLTPLGRCFAFEPIPANYTYLKNNFQNVDVFNIAVSDKKGQSTFQYVKGRPARSGLLKVKYPNPREIVEEISVPLDTLDNLIPGNMNIDLIKIDVEGAELLVIKGGRNLIKRTMPFIVFEHALNMAEVYCQNSSEAIYSLLCDECCLKISSLKNWIAKNKPYSRTEFVECVQMNREFYFIASPNLNE